MKSLVEDEKMELKLEDFAGNFPSNVEIPDLMIKLLNFQNANDSFCNGNFELIDKGVLASETYFEYNLEVAQKVIVFGHEPDGAMYAYWLYDEKDITTAPIVFLGSEGTDNKVVANSLEEFLMLLTVGADGTGYAGYNLKAEWYVPPPENRLAKFREWLAGLGIYPGDAKTIVDNAKQSHPDFDRWIEEKLNFQENSASQIERKRPKRFFASDQESVSVAYDLNLDGSVEIFHKYIKTESQVVEKLLEQALLFLQNQDLATAQTFLEQNGFKVTIFEIPD
jgi:hypothetical protein